MLRTNQTMMQTFTSHTFTGQGFAGTAQLDEPAMPSLTRCELATTDAPSTLRRRRRCRRVAMLGTLSLEGAQ